MNNNLGMVVSHFERLYPELKGYIDMKNVERDMFVVPLFIINAPTLYMYDGKFEVLNYKTFPDFLDENYHRTTFVVTNEDSGQETNISYPYFRNLRDLDAYN